MMYRFLLSVFLLINFAITPSFAQGISNTIINSQNYLSSALVPNNKVVKWQKMPISVYIQNNKYSKIVESAFQEWQIASDRIVSFKQIDSKEKADITVCFVDDIGNALSEKDFHAGISKTSYMDNVFMKAEIILLKSNPINKKAFTQKQMYIIALHEIGHSIGIIGHSPNKDDLMYYLPSPSTQGLSPQDINTIKLIYSPESKNFKVDPYIIQQKIGEAKSYVQEFPNSPYSWLKLADLYRANGQYKEAITGYNKAIRIDRSYSQAYYSIALCYYRMNYIKLSFKYFQSALQKEPENTKFIYAYTKICIETNQKAKAEKYLSNYLKNYPNAKNDAVIQDAIKMLK